MTEASKLVTCSWEEGETETVEEATSSGNFQHLLIPIYCVWSWALGLGPEIHRPNLGKNQQKIGSRPAMGVLYTAINIFRISSKRER